MEKDLIGDYVSVSLEEYKTLREEIKQSNVNQFQSLSFGSAAVGVLLSAGFYSWNKTLATTNLIFSLFIPLLSFLSTFLWLGEIARMIRAGNFIVIIENKIRTIVQVPPDLLAKQAEYDQGVNVTEPLSWERYLRASRGSGLLQGHMVWVYKVRFWIFPAVAMLSWGVGGYYLSSQLVTQAKAFLVHLVVGNIIVLCVWIYMLIKAVKAFSEITKR